jgi:signal transduction histidine kinase
MPPYALEWFAAMADGRFEAPEDLPYDREDEIGHLSRAFGTMTERLAELDRLKAEFVSLATHELKTPINVIAGYAELLDEGLYGDLDANQRDVVVLIQDQTRSLTRLVNQLLDLSRFEAGGLPVDAQAVDLGVLLEQVEDTFRALATQKQVDFEVVTDTSLPETVIVDADRIRHEVLGNLLSNAFKFTPTGGGVRVRAWLEAEDLHLEVLDNGVGIPQDQIARIFDKYYQVGAEAKAQGSGLGLAIVKHVVEAHGGEVAATSVPGRGTRFHIVLPQGGARAA